MKVADFSVNRALFVNLASMVIIFAGIASFVNMRKEAFPPVAYDAVIITTPFRGASPEKVERLVTDPIEDEVMDVDGVEEVTSTSDEGVSTIMVRISEDAPDKEEVVQDIQKAVDRVTDLPEDVDERPTVTEIKLQNIPVLQVAIGGDIDEFELRRHTDELRELLKNISGVSSVDRVGWRDEEYWVEPDLEKMNRFSLSFSELAQALERQNVDMPGGKQEFDGRERTIKVRAELTTPEQVADTVIRANELGNWIRVRDVAEVRRALADEQVISKTNGKRAIILTVVKKQQGDIVNVVRDVRNVLDRFKDDLPEGVEITTYDDLSYYVSRRLGVLSSNGIIAFILVMVVLFSFLPPVSAFVTALGIPIAFFGTFIVMSMMGITVNLMTMFGLIMVLGMIVDDGIIISENVYRNIEMGMSPKEAAIRGTDEVAAPVLSTVLTTVVAFAPLMFMSGLMGRFVKYVPMVIIIALGASLVEAFFILPSHLADFARPMKNHGRYEDGMHWFSRLRDWYKRMLAGALRYRVLLVSGTVIALIASLALIATGVIPFRLFGSEGLEAFGIEIEAEAGVSLDHMNELVRPVEDLVADLPDNQLESFQTVVGSMGNIRGDDPTQVQRGSSFAQIIVYLTPSEQRELTAVQISERLRAKKDQLMPELSELGIRQIRFVLPEGGPPVGADIEIAVQGPTYEGILPLVERIKEHMRQIPGVMDIDDAYELGSEEVAIAIDEQKAQRAGLSNQQIAYAVRAAFGGAVATTIRRETAEDEILVLVRLPPEQRNDPGVFDRLVIANDRGSLVSLSQVTSRETSQRLRSIRHLDGNKVVSVTASVDESVMTSMQANEKLRQRIAGIDNDKPGYSVTFKGEQEETQKSIASLIVAFAIALFLIFVILATQFNSLMQPLIIMLTIPFGMIGVVLTFLLHREPLSFLAVLGAIGLMGVVVNDSIVLVDFINKHREGKTIRDAVIEAGATRLRPVLITTITTVAGFATVAYGIGGSDPILKPMALAMTWGLVFATLLTLVLIPCIYLLVEDVRGRLKR
jgi:multidrug efflux pump subunit AcrB